MSRQFILGTAGHIDHGKTALVRALTGIDTDRLQEEKDRGISIDLGFAQLDLGDVRLGIVDVPGHERFVRNMLAGAAGIDLALLVVAADDSVMPQTREHLAILRLLKIKHGLIAMTKCDLATTDWLDLVEEDVRELVQGTFLHDAPVIRTSASTGSGIDALKSALRDLCETDRAADHASLFRLPIDRAFVLKGLGTVVTGTVWSGRLEREQEVEWQPCGRRIRARAMHSHGSEVEAIESGQRAACNLPGIHHEEVERGHELAAPGLLRPWRRLTVRIDVLEDAPWPLRHRARVRLHVGTQERLAEVRLLQANQLAPGECGFAQLVTDGETVTTGHQPFVLRAESPVITIGGGLVVQPCAEPISRRDSSSIRHLADLISDVAKRRVSGALRFLSADAWREIDLCRETGLCPQDVAEALVSLRAETVLIDLATRGGERLTMHADQISVLNERLLATMAELHDEAPLDATIERGRVRGRLQYVDESVLMAVIDHALETGALVGDERSVALPDFKPRISREELAIVQRLIEQFEEGGYQPPSIEEAASSVGVATKKVQELLGIAGHQGRLVHLGGGMFLHADHEHALRERIVDALRDGAALTLSEIRQMLDTTRKYALPICQYLDQQGITQRRGDMRVLGPVGREAVGCES